MRRVAHRSRPAGSRRRARPLSSRKWPGVAAGRRKCDAAALADGCVIAMAAFAAVLRKDLRVEIRSGQSTIALFALSLLIMVVLVFALSPQPADRARDGAAALWVAM